MKKYAIIGALVVSVLGTLFHFLGDWIPIILFPMNESIFEHMKLVLFPFLLYFFGSLPFLKANRMDVFSSFVSAILLSMGIIILSYYTYSGMLGWNVDAINIIIYYVAVLAGFILIYKKKTLFSFSNSVIFLLILFVFVVTFSYYPPNISFFKQK
ncbi:MAG: hypothetical protein K2N64_02135 [Anaeroplasmataceae bacterium]|nr:hypothetical protein [Anaeroplasmataceae bacterium]